MHFQHLQFLFFYFPNNSFEGVHVLLVNTQDNKNNLPPTESHYNYKEICNEYMQTMEMEELASAAKFERQTENGQDVVDKKGLYSSPGLG